MPEQDEHPTAGIAREHRPVRRECSEITAPPMPVVRGWPLVLASAQRGSTPRWNVPEYRAAYGFNPWLRLRGK